MDARHKTVISKWYGWIHKKVKEAHRYRIKNQKKKCSKLVVYDSNILKSMMFLSTNKKQLYNAIKNKSHFLRTVKYLAIYLIRICKIFLEKILFKDLNRRHEQWKV